MERTSRPLLHKELGLHYTSIMQHFYFEIQHSQRKRLEIAAVGISYRLSWFLPNSIKVLQVLTTKHYDGLKGFWNHSRKNETVFTKIFLKFMEID